MRQLTELHLHGCPALCQDLERVEAAPEAAEELPFLHVNLFKRHLELRTNVARPWFTSAHCYPPPPADRSPAKLRSIAAAPACRPVARWPYSRILSAVAPQRPLLVLDDARSLPPEGVVSARVAAAMRPEPAFATNIHFLLSGPARSRHHEMGPARRIAVFE